MSQPSFGSPGTPGDAPHPTEPQPGSRPEPQPEPPFGSAPQPEPQPAAAPQQPQYPPTQGWGGTPGQPGALSPQDERNWAMGAHLSSFVAAWIALGVLGPLVVLLMAGNRSAFVRRHAVEALNWNISALIYAAVSTVLVFILVGVPMLVVLGVCYAVFTIMGAMAANRGQEFRYPLTIRFVK